MKEKQLTKEKQLLHYKCTYPGCGYEFDTVVGTTRTNGKHSVSTQIRCKNCRNFLPTFGDKDGKKQARKKTK